MKMWMNKNEAKTVRKDEMDKKDVMLLHEIMGQ
jgi:hypothetical protein